MSSTIDLEEFESLEKNREPENADNEFSAEEILAFEAEEEARQRAERKESEENENNTLVGGIKMSFRKAVAILLYLEGEEKIPFHSGNNGSAKVKNIWAIDDMDKIPGGVRQAAIIEFLLSHPDLLGNPQIEQLARKSLRGLHAVPRARAFIESDGVVEDL